MAVGRASLCIALVLVTAACRSPESFPPDSSSPTDTPGAQRSPSVASASPAGSLAPVPGPSGRIPTIPGAPTGPEITGGTAQLSESSDAAFRLTLETDQDRYRAGQPIRASATLTYLGPQDTVIAWGSSTPGLVGFGVESVDPPITIGAAFTADCSQHPMTRGTPVDYPFAKSGGFSEGEPLAPLYRAYFDDPELRLPEGTWTISAGASFYSGAGCGDALHELTASVTVVVEP